MAHARLVKGLWIISARWLTFAMLAVAALLCLSAPAAAEGGKRPNIIFFLTDDHRFDVMGCAGHPIIKTPTLDDLARRGVRFRNAFVTTSICAASRASILTGLYERTHKYTFGTPPIRDEHTDVSYPVLLRRAGYRTGFVGKFGVGVGKGRIETMFDYFVPLNRTPYFKKLPDGSTRHVDEIAGDRALEFLKGCSGDRPFCLSVSFNASHAEDNDLKDHYPPPTFAAHLYDGVQMPPPRLGDAKIFDSQPDFLKQSLNRVRFFWAWDTPEKYQKNMRNYLRMISGVDTIIGRVLGEVQRRGWEGNTVVIFSADNGYYLANRGFTGKWSHYEDSLRVPLIIADPRQPAKARGRVAEHMALNIDIPATILDLAGQAAPKLYQGRSLLPLLRGEQPAQWRTDFFCEHLMRHPQIPKWEGVRGERWVYARYFEQKPVYEFLHDLRSDPDQLQNFAGDPRHARDLQAMRRRCDELRDRYGGVWTPERFPAAAKADKKKKKV